jgi:hypothetical protein
MSSGQGSTGRCKGRAISQSEVQAGIPTGSLSDAIVPNSVASTPDHDADAIYSPIASEACPIYLRALTLLI